MSMLQEFFVFLADMFQAGDGTMDAEAVKSRLEQEGFDDVTAYDVREAVGLMYEEGDVFNNEQSSVLEAYTGGNYVDQSFNGSNIGVATSGVATGTGATTSSGSSGSSGGGSHQPTTYSQQPPPPPMDPVEGYTDLDAAVQQIVYVSNITNNTTINDQDTFEDNDTIVDSSVNQTILAAGDVTQDFDTAVAGEEGIAVTGDVEDANLVTGDNEGVIADDIEDSNVLLGDNEGVVAEDATGAVVGDNNDTTTLVDSDGNVTGDGSSIDNSTTTTTTTTTTNTNIGGDNISGDGANVTTIEGNNDGVVNTGEGGVEAINDSLVGQASFGEGDITNVIVDDSTISESNFQVGDDNEGDVESNDTLDASIDASVDIVDIDNSAVLGSDVGIVGDVGPVEVEVPEADDTATETTETTGA
jgi:hypothetical protein